MGLTRVLKILRSDLEDSSFAILRVEQSQPGRLDCNLVATDGEAPFVAKIKHSTVERLQAKSFAGSIEQWRSILMTALLQDDNVTPAADGKKEIQLAATVRDEMTIIIRENIDGITQRLGELILQRKEDLEISLFDWSAESAAHNGTLRDENYALQTSLQRVQDEARGLREQLDGAKKDREEYAKTLAQKFAALLNSKKLKIRDQQRLLAKAGLDHHDSKEEHTNSPIKSESRHTQKKRRAEDASLEPKAEEQDNEHSMADEERVTSDEESQSALSPGGSGALSEEDAPQATARQSGSSGDNPLRIPTRRELPFATKRAQEEVPGHKNSQGERRDEEDAEDEDTDDEL